MVPEVLAAIHARPPRARLVVLSDFDGTLASFDVDPSAPRLSEETRDALETLAARGDVAVGLVSGRRVDDLDRRTQLPPHVYLAGLHGLEIRHGAVRWRHPDLVESHELADEVADAINQAVGTIPGVKLEHKGVSVTVHVRAVEMERRDEVLRGALGAARSWLDSGAFRSLDASEAVELLPNIAWTKGDAVRWIVEDIETHAQQPAWCVFFGDDVTDEDAFRAVRHGLTVVVGQRPSLARFRLRTPTDVAAVLAHVNSNGHGKEYPTMTSTDLVRTMADRLRDTKLVVVANRQPYVHEKQVTASTGLRKWVLRQGDKVRINWKQPASGLVTALDPVMQACGGTWVAHGNGTGDLEASDPSGRLAVPPDRPKYSLRRVWLKPQEENGYYYGVSNNALWPLCHIAYARPVFNQGDWRQYVAVNRRFADVVLEEIAGTRAIVFVQDYHYALLPRMVKAARPDAVVCQFWHIPWPNPEAFRIMPWQSEVLDGLLGNDLLGFHLQYHCNNFLETVDRAMEARIDQETFSVYCRGHRTAIRPYPISIDPSTWNGTSPGSAWTKEVAATRKRLDVGDRRIVMGVDRLDYTKGIPDRLLAFDRFLERYPEWRGRVVLVQVGSPTRDRIDRYRDLSREVGELVDTINTRHGMPGWVPIVYRREYHTPKDVAALYRATDVCVVSSLHDGMNLVAKEFVAARSDNRGVLLLSKFAGAARELSDALLVNPFAPDEFADALHAALSMGPGEAERRMKGLRAQVGGHTVFDWAARILCDACKVADGRG